MLRQRLLIAGCCALVLVGIGFGLVQTNGKTMNSPSITLGYVILCVKDVGASLDFYEQAFGLSRRFFNEEGGKAYGELETGAACLAFANLEMAKSSVGQDLAMPSPDRSSLGMEFALVTADVDAIFKRAVQAGATAVAQPTKKPWGQTVAYVRDKDGHMVELCTPVQ
jgi:lactoylglutathione lyase